MEPRGKGKKLTCRLIIKMRRKRTELQYSQITAALTSQSGDIINTPSLQTCYEEQRWLVGECCPELLAIESVFRSCKQKLEAELQLVSER
jgi:hypothetical protein